MRVVLLWGGEKCEASHNGAVDSDVKHLIGAVLMWCAVTAEKRLIPSPAAGGGEGFFLFLFFISTSATAAAAFCLRIRAVGFHLGEGEKRGLEKEE